MGDRESFPRDDRAVLGAGRLPGPRGTESFGEPAPVPAETETRPPASVRLTGRTSCDFDSDFRVDNQAISPGTGCEGCEAADCLRVTGDLVATYRVTTTVTLPRVSSFRRLTPCQRQRVRDAIDNILAPHEQEHVAAFRTYEGTTSTPVDITICRGRNLERRLVARLQSIHDAEEGPRKSAAQTQSDSLDPFHVDVDLNCEE